VEVISERANGKSIVRGIVMRTGESIFARTVLITSGTFMGGILFCGDSRAEGGRIGEAPSVGLSKSLEHLGHSLRRLKTGTPARLNAKSINFSRWSKQWGDSERRLFSWKSAVHKLPQVCCYIGYTNEKTHDVIRKNFHKSPLFSGDIVGTGPRYCPSVEDKVRRFKDKTRHQIFLEPEGLCTNFIYPNGLSTSLPEDVQLEFLRTLDGLEAVEILRPGYAVEYDVIDPRSLSHGFESKTCDGLFVAGQVNRTSGYEEAASQGLWAGMNALLYLRNEEQLIPQRSRSYIETLVDDLVTKGTDEPYRMFTSRSEFRLLLREDNANDRLHDLGCRLGILSDEQRAWYEALNKELVIALSDFKSRRIRLDENRVVSYFEYLKRPEITWENLDSGDQFSDLVIEKIEIDSKYSGYLIKQEAELREYNKLIGMRLKPDLDIRSVYGLSEEVIEKYEILKPKSVFELSQISGMTPSAVLAIARVGAVSRETIA
jgi:tRNA uridine 5-carboxymethylaminomethyl modification enzyme